MSEALSNKFIGEYRLLKLASENYPFAVYLAHDHRQGQTMVLKTLVDDYPKKEHYAILKREFLILEKLKHSGIIRASGMFHYGEGNAAIVMEHYGVSLRQYLDRFPQNICPLDEFFSIAKQMVEALGDIHTRGIIHKDISPDNVLIDPETGKIKFIDFSVSSELSREHAEANFDQSARGSLPYMSPEQSGRMNRDVDFRSDYYSLGCAFYEMLSGQLPFTGEDALEWVYAHISKVPTPLYTLAAHVPKALSLLVDKLMQKNAELRYQSPGGLMFDLVQCEKMVHTNEHTNDFQPGASDVSMTFQISQKLYGRDEELHQLQSIFESACRGSSELCLVSGYSGVGKSVLVMELGRSIAGKKGYLAQGKFEQYRQNKPYMALLSAMRNLVRSLLGEPRHRLEQWGINLNIALQGQGQLLLEHIPELELIIGPQREVPEVPPNEAQNRFALLMIDFLQTIANEEHPLVVFLDDLQWSDIPTLNLIQRITLTQELSHLMLVGAYRNNAVDDSHPLMLTLSEIQKRRSFEWLQLMPLQQEVIANIVSDSLHRTDERASGLSAILFEKTAGNPFFTNEMLHDLHRRNAIYFEPSSGSWLWDEAAVRNQSRSDNVIDFLVEGMRQLPESTRYILQVSAAIGAEFDLQVLVHVTQLSAAEVAAHLFPAIQAHHVLPLDDDYRFVAWMEQHQSEGTEAFNFAEVNPVYRFQHDRVQQAAYSTLDAEKRKALHLRIGEMYLGNDAGDEAEEMSIQAAEHLNQASGLVTDVAKRRRFAEVNLHAAIKARASSAYASALGYLEMSCEWLDGVNWESYPELMWDVRSEMQNCYYLTGDWTRADEVMEELMQHTPGEVARGKLFARRTRQYATTGRMIASIDSAYEGLHFLGFEALRSPSEQDIQELSHSIQKLLAGREVKELVQLPALTDERAQIAGELYAEVFAAAFLSASGLKFPYLIMSSVKHSLVYGNDPNSAFAYATYGMLLCGYYNQPAVGIQYGRLGITLIDRYNDISLKSRLYYVYTMFVHHWSYHWKSMTEWFRKGIDNGYQTGDLLYLSYSAQDCIIWDPTLDLETAYTEHKALLKIVKECDYRDSFDSGSLFLQMQLNFLGRTKDRFSLSSEDWNEEECLEGMKQRNFMTGIANYHIYKAELYVLYQEPKKAWEHVEVQDTLMASVMSLPQLARYHFISFLIRAAKLDELSFELKSVHLQRMQESLQTVHVWSSHCPENFAHLEMFMQAVLADYEGRQAEAWVLFEQSIAQARTTGFMRDEALANEYMAVSLARKGFFKATEGYLRAAHHLFYRWAAHCKTEQLEELYPFLKKNEGRPSKAAQAGQGTIHTAKFNNVELDIASVFKASQTISGELVLDNLLEATLRVILENAGAQIGHLLVYRDEKYFLFTHGSSHIREFRDTSEIEELPLTLVNTVLRMKKPLILQDASASLEFQADPYIVRNHPKSVICVPFSINSFFKIAIYLENNLTTNAFTEERYEVIQLLATQAAISIENARIYEKQESLVKAQQRFVPSQFLKHLGHDDIAKVGLGESVGLEMSILFSDIRDFTPLVEALQPQQVIELLNDYLSRVGVEIDLFGGFVDSYAGDEIMALFAVPPQEAVTAAVQMKNTLHLHNQDLKSQGKPMLSVGIGINTGNVVLGTMGSNNRMQCTVLGDAVNLASRIEQLTKPYGAKLLIGEATFQRLSAPEKFNIRYVDCVAVKGKAKAVKLYEVIDAETLDRQEAKLATMPLLNDAVSEYYARRFAQARSLFMEAQSIDAADKVFPLFIQRCEDYLITPPAEDWQGFEVLKSKS